MLDYPIIDVHVHAYATAEMHRQVLRALGGPGREPQDDGTPEALLQMESTLSTSKGNGGILKNITPTAEMAKAAWDRVDHRLTGDEEPKMYASVKEMIAGRIRRRNAWGNEVTKKHPTVVNFIGVDPNFMTPEENVAELELRVKEGAKGVALHTTRNLHRPEDRRLYPMYETAQKMGIPFLAHTGNEGYRPAYMGLNSRPSDFKYVFQDFPRLRFILCHMAAGYFEEAIELAHKNPNVYFDTAGPVSGGPTPQIPDDGELVRLIRRFGPEKLVFGSDWSLGSMLACANRLISLPLTDKEKELIFYRNTHDFLGIKPSAKARA